MRYNNNKPLDTLTLGPNVKDIEHLVQHGSRDNANIQYNPESIHKYVADASMKQYALIKMFPARVAESHLNGYIHVHDAEYAFDRPLNCLQHDLRFFICNGLKVDGNGLSTSVAGPAKNLETLINHAGQMMGSGQTNMSGGQGISFFNIFLAPYVEGLNYERIKQAMQAFIFNANMSYISRGSQPVFSTVGLEFDVPVWLQDKPAYGPNGISKGTYADYHEEAQTILKAYTEVMLEGDYFGKPHLFPNSVYYLRDSSFDYPELIESVHNLSAKFSIPYFAKELDGPKTVMGCRTVLNTNWTNDPEQDILRTGNLAYISLNLPRYALKNNFWDELDLALDIATEALIIRRAHAEKLLKGGLMKFLTQKGADGDEYYRIDNSTLSFGVVGLSDALRVLTGMDICNNKSRKLGHQIMRYINDYAKQLTEETGFRWTVLQTPAEATAGKFAREDRRRFGNRAPVHGERGGYYYTNSTHVDVDSPILLPERVRTEHNFHNETNGGHIMHLWLGESYSDPKALESLTRKIYKNSNAGFWTYTTAFSVCTKENKMLKGIHEQCECGAPVEVYDRITGYLQRVSGYNNAKQSEFKDRKRY